jgi:hypothetical protein
MSMSGTSVMRTATATAPGAAEFTGAAVMAKKVGIAVAVAGAVAPVLAVL